MDKEKLAEQAAFEHTVFMALAEINAELNPRMLKSAYLDKLDKMKREHKAMILNEYKTVQN